jgi:hypothetical protein
MTKQQAHALKLKMALFAEKTAMIEWASKHSNEALEVVLTERDRVRIELYNFIDSLIVTEE